MDKIAFISGTTVVYWQSIVLTLAAATAIMFFLAFYIGKCGGRFIKHQKLCPFI